jgi:ankyrin repeat protein
MRINGTEPSLINATSDLEDPECVELLVESGADINWRDCHKRTPLGYAAKMEGRPQLALPVLERG